MLVLPTEVRIASIQLVRFPYSSEFVPAVCLGHSKDACVRISDIIRSNMATAISGVALASKTD